MNTTRYQEIRSLYRSHDYFGDVFKCIELQPSDTFYNKMSGFGALNDPFANAVDKTDRVNHWYFDNVPKTRYIEHPPPPPPPPREPEQRARTVEHTTTLRAFTEPQEQFKFGPCFVLKL